MAGFGLGNLLGMGGQQRGGFSLSNSFNQQSGIFGLVSPVLNLGMTAVQTPFSMINGAMNGQGFGGTVGGLLSPIGNLAETAIKTPFQIGGNALGLLSGLFNMLSGASGSMPSQNIQLGQVNPMYNNQSYSQPLNGSFFGRGPSMFG